MNHDLAGWLARIEQLHPRAIELGLDRVRAVADRLGIGFDCPVLIVGGTNGKGSTCAILESILMQAGYRTGCYTSPHLIAFNERARIEGRPASDDALIGHFEAVESARQAVSLTYFEFTTLAILRLFQQSGLDVVILEVGLGGRLDAVNLIDADCTVLTSIDIDHAEWLGETREAIGAEKAHIFRPGRPAVCADPSPPRSVIEHARTIGADLRLFGRDFNYAGDRQQWSWAGRSSRRNSLAYPALRGANQLLNASAALAALESLRDRLPVPQQAVRQGLALVELTGRFQVLPGQPAVILDVAHNPHAAAHLAANLESMGFFPYTWAVFGVLGDKDVDGIIAAMRPCVDHWKLAALPGPRAADPQGIVERLLAAGVRTDDPQQSITVHPGPAQALAAARSEAKPDDRIVVFGSFLTVAGVLAERASQRQPSTDGQAQR